MDNKLSAASASSTNQHQSALDEFEALSTEEAIAYFGNRCTREQELFNYDAEATSIDVKKQKTYKEIDPIISNEELNEPQLKKELWVKKAQIELLNDRREDAQYLQSFMENRMNQWQLSKIMLFGSFEPDIKNLIAAIERDTITGDSTFVPVNKFRTLIDTTQPGIAIDAQETPIRIPLSAVVSAFGFVSWEEGRGKSYTKQGMTSLQLIKKYASLPTEIPPIESATALLLPDKKVIVQSREGHRVAAAKLKGQKYIDVLYLKVRRAKP
jgi:hypothetical protein